MKSFGEAEPGPQPNFCEVMTCIMIDTALT